MRRRLVLLGAGIAIAVPAGLLVPVGPGPIWAAAVAWLVIVSTREPRESRAALLLLAVPLAWANAVMFDWFLNDDACIPPEEVAPPEQHWWTPWSDCGRDEGGGPTAFVAFFTAGLVWAGAFLARLSWPVRWGAMTASFFAALVAVYY